VLWTFDPLQARNAHLNFNRSAFALIDYVENMYGITASPLHHGLATDRLVVMLPPGGQDDARCPTDPNGVGAVLTPFPRTVTAWIDLEITACPPCSSRSRRPARVIATTPEVAGRGASPHARASSVRSRAATRSPGFAATGDEPRVLHAASPHRLTHP
jgi:hypothetical protein